MFTCLTQVTVAATFFYFHDSKRIRHTWHGLLLRILCLGMVPIWAYPHFWQKTPEIAKQTSNVSGTTEPVMLGWSMRECLSQMVPLDFDHPQAVGSEPTSNNTIMMMKWWISFINSGILWHYRLVKNRFYTQNIKQRSAIIPSQECFRCFLQMWSTSNLVLFEVWILWPLEGDSIWDEVQGSI